MSHSAALVPSPIATHLAAGSFADDGHLGLCLGMETESSPGQNSSPSPQGTVLGSRPFLRAICQDAGGEQEEGTVLNPGHLSSRTVTCV